MDHHGGGDRERETAREGGIPSLVLVPRQAPRPVQRRVQQGSLASRGSPRSSARAAPARVIRERPLHDALPSRCARAAAPSWTRSCRPREETFLGEEELLRARAVEVDVFGRVCLR